jgi:glutamate--cysteine ligase
MTQIHCPTAPRPHEEPAIGYDDLVLPFRSAEKRDGKMLIGIEAEKFGVVLPSAQPLPYAGDTSVSLLLQRFAARGFVEQRETPRGPVIALSRDRSSITLEPGGQFELSGAPHADLHAAHGEIEQHHAELAELSADLGIAWCSVGFHPLARREQMPWVPKLRYAIMREYLPSLGDGALDMMQRTATIQVNLDFTSEADAMRKLSVMLRLSPLVHAITTHSPFFEGRLTASNSLRGDVWTRMDKSRSGLIERLLVDRSLGYGDYVEWALDAGMFLFKRHGEIVANTGQSFRDFLRRGYQGQRATMSDWKLHLNTLFPEVRLKNTLEARSADAQPNDTMMAVPALWVGLMYDASALSRAEELAHRFGFEELRRDRSALIASGLRAKLGPHSVKALGLELLEIAQQGLLNRARLDTAGNSEAVYLEPLMRLVESGMTPADRLRSKLDGIADLGPREIIEATRIL